MSRYWSWRTLSFFPEIIWVWRVVQTDSTISPRQVLSRRTRTLILRQVAHFRERNLTFEGVEGELEGLSLSGVVSVFKQRRVCALVILQTLLCCWLLFMQLLEDGCCLEVDLIRRWAGWGTGSKRSRRWLWSDVYIQPPSWAPCQINVGLLVTVLSVGWNNYATRNLKDF